MRREENKGEVRRKDMKKREERRREKKIKEVIRMLKSTK